MKSQPSTLSRILFCAVLLLQSGFGQGELESGDTLSIVVFDEPSVSGSFTVSTQGAINYPLLGKIEVKGKGVDEIATLIESRLEADYIRDAQVTVDLAKRLPNTALVIGSVLQPGSISFEVGTRMDLFTAIASAGGVADNANQSRIEIKRRKDDSLASIYANLDSQKDMEILDDDTIIVPSLSEGATRTVAVLGQVKKPGMIEFPPGKSLSLVEAIALAGGPTPLANTRRVSVRRKNEVMSVNFSQMERGETQPISVSPGDSIYVPESIF